MGTMSIWHWLVILCLLVFGIVLPVWLAIRLNAKLQARAPQVRPFAWDYYNGISLMFGTLVVALIALGQDESIGKCIFGCGAILTGVAGYYIIQRRRWAWVVGSLIQINIVTWIVNWIYGRNRWAEFEAALTMRIHFPLNALADRHQSL